MAVDTVLSKEKSHQHPTRLRVECSRLVFLGFSFVFPFPKKKKCKSRETSWNMCSLLLRILRFASVSFDIYLFIYLFFSWLIAKKPESAAALDSLSRVGAWDLSLLDTVPDSRRETRAGVPAWATRDRQALGPRSERRDSARPAQFRREGLSLWWCFRRFTYGNLVLFPCQIKNKNNVRAGSRVETCKTSTPPPKK